MSIHTPGHGSQGDAESSDDNEDENANDNIDHKNLEQWEEKNKADAVGMDAMEVDDETGQSVSQPTCMAINCTSSWMKNNGYVHVYSPY